MAYSEIVMQVGDAPREALRIAAAADLAHRMDARLHGVLVAPAAKACSAVAAQRAFAAATALCGADADWVSTEPVTETAFVDRARSADLVIASLEPYDPGRAADAARLAQSCGRPLLVLPPGGEPRRLGRCVLVAWNDSEQAWRALDAALPLLQAAESIWVVSTTPNAGDATAAERKLEAYLGDLGIVPMMVRRCGSSTARAAIAEAATCGADLLVMDLEAWRQLTEPRPRRERRPPRRKGRPATLIAG